MIKQLFFCSIVLPIFFLQSSIYNVTVTSVNGNIVSLASFANKKIIVAAFNAADPDYNWLRHIDSLQVSDTSIQVILVPGNDLGGAGNNIQIANVVDSLSLHALVLQCTLVKKDAGLNQHPLFRWLTDLNENDHFERDAEAKQLFIVNRSGILYGILGSEVPSNVVLQVLGQTVTAVGLN